jgi:hypothetical protein
MFVPLCVPALAVMPKWGWLKWFQLSPWVQVPMQALSRSSEQL